MMPLFWEAAARRGGASEELRDAIAEGEAVCARHLSVIVVDGAADGVYLPLEIVSSKRKRKKCGAAPEVIFLRGAHFSFFSAARGAVGDSV